MSATNSRIAKLNRALRQLEDYEQHKADWKEVESRHFGDAFTAIDKLIVLEKQRRIA